MRISDWSSDVCSSDLEEATQALAESGATLVAVESNPIDAVWADRPQPSDAKLPVQPDVAAGKSSAQKRQEIADWLAAKKADAVVLSALDSSEEHTSELQSLMRNSYAVFCLKNTKK